MIDLGIQNLWSPHVVNATPPGTGGARDLGIGDDPALKLFCIVTANVTPVGGTVGIILQGAPDNTPVLGDGVTPVIPPVAGTFYNMYTSPVLTAPVAGTYIGLIDLPRPPANQPPPRFLQLIYNCGGAVAAGTLKAGIVLDRFDQITGNFTSPSTGALGGYPPGLVVPN
jgi:hypothetical protein